VPDILSWVKYAREVEIHKAGNAQALIDWYNNGADGGIDWGQPGDFEQCVAIAGKHIDNPEGFCQLRHIDATGEPSGHAPGEKFAKGGPGSGAQSGHAFNGNQYIAASERLANQGRKIGQDAESRAYFLNAPAAFDTPSAEKNARMANSHYDLRQMHLDASKKYAEADEAARREGDTKAAHQYSEKAWRHVAASDAHLRAATDWRNGVEGNTMGAADASKRVDPAANADTRWAWNN